MSVSTPPLEKMPQSRKCDFCDEVSGGSDNTFASRYRAEFPDRSVFTTGNLMVLPSLGQIVEGHVLIVPRLHYVTIGDLPLELVEETQVVAELVRKGLRETYRNCIFFEHGARESAAGGCGIYHAHLHAVPVGRDPVQQLMKQHLFVRIENLGELARASAGHSYLYYETLSLERYVCRVDNLPSQYMRRLLAEFIGESHWNWRDAGKEAALRSAFTQLSSWFARHGAASAS